MEITLLLTSLGLFVGFVMLIYVIVKRIQDKNDEDFEKRDH